MYYLGAIFGCFGGGWLADRIGRINGLLAGSLFALVGGALQAAQNSNFMICARVVTGLGQPVEWIEFKTREFRDRAKIFAKMLSARGNDI